jgi:hypothetical protein
MSPDQSDDLTHMLEQRANRFVVLRSVESADDTPDYEIVARFPSRELAEAYLADRHIGGNFTNPANSEECDTTRS